MTTYTKINKASGTTYTKIGVDGGMTYDDVVDTYDNADSYDGMAVSGYTKINKATGTAYTKITKAT